MDMEHEIKGATPAQPIAPPAAPMTTDEAREYLVEFMEQHFSDKTFNRYILGTASGSRELAGDFAWQMATALRRLAPVAQPIAVSAPTDEQVEAALVVYMAAWTDHDSMSQCKRNGIRAVLEFAARAAAPVSGPTEDTLTKLHNRVKEMQEAAYTFGEYSKEAVSAALDGVLDEIAAISAAPVSAQGATLPQEFDADLWAAVAQGWCEKGQTHKIMDSDLAIAIVRNVQKAIDSRAGELEAARIAYASEFPPNVDGEPDVGNIHANIRKLKARSEGIRAEVLEEAARVCEDLSRDCDDEHPGNGMSDGAKRDCAATIRALASTTPQKADDE